MTLTSLLAWSALAIALVIAPGPDSMLVAGNAARHGFRAGMASALGILTGGVAFMALCGFGFLSVIVAVPWLFLAVKTGGALYLAWLGVKLLRGAARSSSSTAPILESQGEPFRQGLITTLLNPKNALFYLAILPQFVGTDSDAPIRGVALIAIVYVFAMIWLTSVSTIAARVGFRVGRSRAVRWMEAALGAAFIGFAGKLAISRT